jgi:transcriptional regulator with XRE-family HTH domain
MRLTSVKLRRFERHLLQIQVARRADIPCSRLAEIENGHAEPQADELERIATVLGVPMRDLLASVSRALA